MSRPVAPSGYDTRVFINCPFDDEYQPLFRALVFTIESCGLSACCALEVDDSGETRAEKIFRLIAGSRLGVHDISRTEPTAGDGEPLPRFNMPYEFGVFTGFRYGGAGLHRRKAALVLDRAKYRYQKFLSDIAGQDIRGHGNDPAALVREVRGWLQAQAGTRDVPGAEYITARFRAFTAATPGLLAAARKTAADLSNYRDLHNLITGWVGSDAG